MNNSEKLVFKLNSLLEAKPIKDPEKILRSANAIGMVTTPKGALTILELVQSRGSSTGFMPKAFRYVQLPDNGSIFRLDRSIIKQWKTKADFVIKMFNNNRL